jgi:putative Mg2+ transporter-C (MgtC) family protein
MMDTVLETLRTELADLGDTADITRVVLRLFVASALGACLGWERERAGAMAGLRTHMLVALGVAMMIVASQLGGVAQAELSRVLQGIFAGVGFVGAAAIIRPHDGERVHGVTTAASIWATASIAAAAGLGLEAPAIVATVFAVVILAWLRRVERKQIARQLAKDDDGPA